MNKSKIGDGCGISGKRYEDELYDDGLGSLLNGKDSFSLDDAEDRSEELVKRLYDLGVSVPAPGHRVRPQDEKDNTGEYERRVEENGTITFYSGDESSVESIDIEGKELEDHEFGHHLGHELADRIEDSITKEGIGNSEAELEKFKVRAYLTSENFADRFRVAVSGEDNSKELDYRSGRSRNYSGTLGMGEKYAIGRENWDESLEGMINSLESEVEEMVGNLADKGWNIECSVL